VLLRENDALGRGREANRSTLARRLLRTRAVHSFDAHVVLEGRSASRYRSRLITIPAPVVRAAETEGLLFPGWIRLHIDSSPPVFVRSRRTRSADHAVVVLPTWRFGRLPRGRLVHCGIESATPWQARSRHSKQFDWLDYQRDSNLLATDQNGELTIHYRRDPFTLRRHPDFLAMYWLLGLYQAEGSKKAGNEWSVVSSNARILRTVVETLNKTGISNERMALEVLHHKADSAAAARAEFAAVGPRITNVRSRTAHKKWKNSGNRGGVLHVKMSMQFYRMTMCALQDVLADGGTFPSRAAARAFALGWLEGDGSVSINKTVIRLRLHGTRDETKAVLRALEYGFNWPSKRGAFKSYTHETSISARQAADLASAGAFRFSMNRARLLYGLLQNTETLRAVYARWPRRRFAFAEARAVGLSGVANLVRRRSLVHAAERFWLTPASRALCGTIATLMPEIETLRRFSPSERLGVTGKKCAAYPIDVEVTSSTYA